MTRNKLLLCLAALVLLLIILRLIPENLNFRIGPIKVLSLELWIAIFVMVSLSNKTSAFLGADMLWGYAYAIVVLVMDIMGHLVYSSSVWLSAQVRPFLFALVLFNVFAQNPEIVNKRKLMNFTAIIIGLSCLINIYSLIRYPLAVRYIVGGGEGAEGRDFYSRIGISNYGFFSGLPMLIPVLFYAYRKTMSVAYKWLYAIIVILIVWALFLSTITTPILIAVSSALLSLVGVTLRRRIYSILLVTTIILLSFIVSPQQVFNYSIQGLINISPSSDVRRRLNDIKIASVEGVEITSTGRTETTVEQRLQRVFWNLETFARNPIVGSSKTNTPEAFHLFWLYFLASLGLLGFLPFLLSVYSHISVVRKRVDKEFWYYYLLSLVGFIVSGLLKNITGWFMYIVPFFIVPGMYYLVTDIAEDTNYAGHSGLQAEEKSL